MLSSHAKRVFCDNVTCFGTNKCCSNWRIGVICQGASSAPSLLACKTPRVQLSICLPIGLSRIHLTSSLYRHSVRTSWEFLMEGAGMSPTYQVTYLLGGRMKVPHLMSVRPMECWLATQNASSPTMSHALGKNKSCSNRSHLPQCFIKALCFLLAWLLCFYTEKSKAFSGRRCSQYPPIVPAVTFYTLPWK